MTKDKKQTPQQVFNQFLFAAMMEKIRAGEEITKWIETIWHDIESLDTAQGFLNKDQCELSQRVRGLEEKSNHIEAENHSLLNGNYERRIEKLENTPATSLNTAIIANHSKRIGDLERENTEALNAHGTRGLQLATIIQRIADLEEANAGLWEAGTEQDAGILSLLKALPDIEILKTRFGGLDKSYADTIRTFELKMKEQREDYHAHIRQLVEENEAAHKSIELQGA